MTTCIPSSQYTARGQEGKCPSPAIRASDAVVELQEERAVLKAVRFANADREPDEGEDEVKSDDDNRSFEDQRELFGCVRTSASELTNVRSAQRLCLRYYDALLREVRGERQAYAT